MTWNLSRRTSLSILFALGASLAFAGEKQEFMIPMRDGVKLAAHVYLPDGPGPFPVILSRTPYGKDRGSDHELYLKNGYARVVQDVRGKFKSEGKYVPWVNDIEDGYDTLEWIAKQPWSNKKIGMTGASALGITTHLAAMSGSLYLKAAYVTVSHGNAYANTTPGGLHLMNMSDEWLKRQGVDVGNNPKPRLAYYDDDARRLDMKWSLAKINVPFYSVAGWYDIFQQGSIDTFTQLQKEGGPGAKGNQKLYIGGFGHRQLMGDLKYSPEAAGRPQADAIRFFDYWLKGVDNGIMKEPAVKYYVLGDTFDKSAPGNVWKTSDTWPPASNPTPVYLNAGNKLTLKAPIEKGMKVTYVYDPKNPTPTFGGNNLMMDAGPMDQRPASSRKDVVKFESDPLDHAVEVAGRVSAELYVSTDAEDSDIIVKFVDVYPNGYEALIMDQGTRLRLRNGVDKPTLVEKNQVYKVKVDLWSTAIAFNKGHKIAIHIQSSNSPRFEPHPNTWDPVKSYDQSVKANNTIHFGVGQESKLILPVVKVYGPTASSGAGQ
jgi:predicted acyl esterase